MRSQIPCLRRWRIWHKSSVKGFAEILLVKKRAAKTYMAQTIAELCISQDQPKFHTDFRSKNKIKLVDHSTQLGFPIPAHISSGFRWKAEDIKRTWWTVMHEDEMGRQGLGDRP